MDFPEVGYFFLHELEAMGITHGAKYRKRHSLSITLSAPKKS
jgi:hypothetical protein